MLKKKGNRSFRDFPCTTLYLDDLKEIVEIFHNSCKKIEVHIGDFEFDDPSELETLAKKLPERIFPEIEIQGIEPFVRLQFFNAIDAYISEDTLVENGIVAKARTIIERGKKSSVNFWDLPTAIFFISSIVVVVFFGHFLEGIVGMVLSMLFSHLALNKRFKNRVIVFTESRGAQRSFFSRKKDEIYVALISATIGAVIGGIATAVLDRLFHHIPL